MNVSLKLASSIIVGVALAAGVLGTVHAQAKGPVYVITEITVSNMDGYLKEYSPKVAPQITKAGGKRLAAGGTVTSIEGAPPVKRVSIQQWDSLEQFKAYRDSAEFKELRKIGNKYAKFRTYTVEALP
jgi:uncharacterized protein (DUF1330 family)